MANPLLDQLHIKRETYNRALRGNKLTYEERMSLNEKLDAVVDEIEALTECPTCHHIGHPTPSNPGEARDGRYCTCPF